MQAEISNGSTIKNFSIKLPVYKKHLHVSFYPEGGHLVNNANNIIGWEVTNAEGAPLPVTAMLYKDSKVLQKIETNEFGMGKFTFTPQAGAEYYVKINVDGKDSAYKLPEIIDSGIAISIENALASDTVYLKINDKGEPKKLLLLIHDYNISYINAALGTTGKPMLVKIALDDVPRGIATLTILDNLGRPLAERLFIAHFNRRANLTINTDSATYSPRKTVQVKLKITDKEQHPLQGLVSVACVQNSRIDILKALNIETYTMLTNPLSAFPFKRDLLGSAVDNKAYLEQLLLIRGWRKYTWQDVGSIKAADTLVRNSPMLFNGNIMYGKKPLKKPVMLNVKKYVTPQVSELEIIYSDSIGNFNMPHDKIVTAPNNKIELSVRNAKQEFYNIHINDPYKELNKKLVPDLGFRDYSPSSFTQSSQAYVFKNVEVAKTLSSVTIKAKKEDNFYGSRIPGPNACGDYVCSYNILNCINHAGGYQPEVGKTYSVRYGESAGSKIVYTGCVALRENTNQFLVAMQGIYSAKEFYVSDLSKMDLADPQYLSTLYWNYSILTDENGVADFQFSTSDITGKFRIIVQGITDHNVVYGEQVIEVKEQE